VGSNLATPVLLNRQIIGKMDFKKSAEIDIIFLCLIYYFFIDTEYEFIFYHKLVITWVNIMLMVDMVMVVQN
jgi:hypothetical protein